jgi:hypothetical protein
MKKYYLFLLFFSSLCFKMEAQTYLDGNIFGQRLLSIFKCYCHNYSNDVFVDSLISANFTEELKTVLFEDLHGGHGYDFITMGFYDYENIESSATVMARDHYLTIKYNYLGWPSNQLDTDSVYYFFNSEGKISHIMRPEDQHVIPNDVPIEPITFRYTVDPTR